MDESFILTSIRKIKEAIDNNKLVLFVGAGVSANSGLPTWGKLVQSFADELSIKDYDHSLETLLKIPQYYFNERGEKEYFDKLNEVFSEEIYKINPIHELIFKMLPRHIVTTNFDDLLEQAASKYSGFYHTVRDDFDLPYDSMNKMIIKMHGDFSKKNVVLKEDDFLSYSNNFRLIENYIKSLISTNVVLFIGYSANDPNFKLIFQWVKELLKGHFQPAYLMDVSSEAKSMEFNYYKNRGINILYHNQIKGVLKKENKFSIYNERGNNLYDFLNFILESHNVYSIDDVDYVYKKLEVFKKLNFIIADDVIKALDMGPAKYDYSGNRKIFYFNDDNPLVRVFSEENILSSKNIKIHEIVETFKKANITGIETFDKDIIDWGIISEIKISEKIEDLTQLKRIEITPLINLITNDLTTFGEYYNLLESAFILYKEEKYYEAYSLYKHLSIKAFESKEYHIHFISEFNRMHVGKRLRFEPGNSKEIENEVKKINLESLFESLPLKEQRSLMYLKDLSNFQIIYKNKFNLDEQVKKIKNNKILIENGGFSTDFSIISSIHLTENLWNFINCNFLCIEHYTEVKSLYKSFVEGVIASYSTTQAVRDGMFSGITYTKVDQFDKFTLFLMITFFDTKQLEDLFDIYGIDNIVVETAARDYLFTAFSNLIEQMLLRQNVTKSRKHLCNFLSIFSKIELHERDFKLILSNMEHLLSENLLHLNDEDFLNSFIVRQINRGTKDKESIISIMLKYLTLYNKNKNIIDFYNGSFFINLTKVIKNEYPETIDSEVISDVISYACYLLESSKKNELYVLLERIIIPIFELCSKNLKSEIKKIIEALLNLEENETFNTSLARIYNFSIFEKIIEPNAKQNNKLINNIYTVLEEKKGIKLYPCPIKANLSMLTDLFRFGFIHIDVIKDHIDIFKGHSEYFDLIFCSNEFDYTKLTPKLLNLLKQSEIDTIMKNQEIKEKIYDKIENEIFAEMKKNKLIHLLQNFYIPKY
jgi:hypothetical protein